MGLRVRLAGRVGIEVDGGEMAPAGLGRPGRLALAGRVGIEVDGGEAAAAGLGRLRPVLTMSRWER